MPTVKEIYDMLDCWAPFNTALGFDNAGLLVGSGDRAVSKVAVCLDITADAVSKASALGAQLIVSHHPVIFDPMRSLDTAHPVYRLAAADISAVCAHTNLDAAVDGVNDALAHALGMENVQPLTDGDPDHPPMVRIGDVPKMSADEFAAFIKQRLGVGGVKYVPTAKAIRRVAVCGGAGGEFVFDALKDGCDALVTGESKHHLNLFARENGIALYVCGHFATEQVIKNRIAKRLADSFGSLEVIVLDESDPAKYL